MYVATPCRRLANPHGTVVVAVTVMRVVKVPVDDVINVARVRNAGVSARRPVQVVAGVSAARVRSALRGVLRRRRQLVLVNVASVDVMEVTIVEIVVVLLVAYARMSAVVTVDVIVIHVGVVVHRRALTLTRRTRHRACARESVAIRDLSS
jgi:hypothetical protein